MDTLADRFGFDLVGEQLDPNDMSDQELHMWNVLNKVQDQMIGSDGLTERQKEFFVGIADTIGDHENVKGIYPFVNMSESASGNSINGYACALDGDAPALVDYMPEDMLECTAMAKICNAKTDLNPKALRALGGELNKAVPTFSENPVSLDKRNPETNLDSADWQEEIGNNGEAGIYMTNDPWKPEYYVVVRSGVPRLSRELSRLIQKGRYTIAQVLTLPEYVWARQAARRNALRLMYGISSKLGLRIGSSHKNKVQNDFASYTTPTSNFKLMSVPEHIQFNSGLEKVSLDGQDAYVVFKDVVPASSSDQQLLVYGGAMGGYKSYKTKTKTDPSIGYPASTKKSNVIRPGADVGQPIYASCFTWDGKRSVSDCNNSRLHPEYFPPVNSDFENKLEHLGLHDTKNSKSLIAVCVKLPADEQQRFVE